MAIGFTKTALRSLQELRNPFECIGVADLLGDAAHEYFNWPFTILGFLF
jgi:hypothetical protein